MARELLDTGSDKRFMRREAGGRFDDSDDVGRSLAQDRQRKAKRVVKAGEGDRGDQKPRPSKGATAGAKGSAAAKPKSPAATSRTAKARPRAKDGVTGKGRSKSAAAGR